MQFQGPTVRSAISKAVSAHKSFAVNSLGKPDSISQPASLAGGFQGPQRFQCGRPIESEFRQRLGAQGDFARNWAYMHDADFIDGDKYFHCVANCQATQRGPAGEAEAVRLSDSREWIQDRLPGYNNDGVADQQANRDGRDGARANPCQSCDYICQEHRPFGLPQQYRAR